MTQLSSQRGTALMITLAIMMLLTLAAIMAVDTAKTDIDLSFNQMRSDQAFYVALAGVERARADLDFDHEWRTGFSRVPFGPGAYTVIVLDSAADSSLGDTVVLRAVGQADDANSIVEVMLLENLYHPLYYHAIYAGNSSEYDPSVDSQSWVADMSFGGTGYTRDIINGDVFFNGHMAVNGDAELNGSAYTGGDYTGNPPTGTANTNQDYLAPPDLLAEHYETSSDFYVGDATSWDPYGHLPYWDPRHIFVKEYRSDLATTVGYNFDNTNYFFGDPWEGSDLAEVSVSSAGNKKVYFVDGNLWIEPNGMTQRLIKSPPTGTQITVVVKGNIYFSDDLLYDKPELDGIAFIAMTDGESYTDQNGNSQYDPGEPLLHDDGDGVYEGPIEGSGNIRFGDPNGGPLGQIQSYLYAENNFEDYVLDGPYGSPQNFAVKGLLSAGNQMRIKRDGPTGHSQMRVTYDDRLQKGTLELPGLPRHSGTETSGWRQVAWREL